MILNKWEESIIVKGKGSRKGTVMVQIVNECTELYEVCKQSVKDGCSIKNRKTRSCYQIGFLDSDKNKPFKHNKQEYNKWCTLIRKYAKKGIECEKFCSFVEFISILREHPAYDGIMNDDSVIITSTTKDGKIFVNKRRNYSKDMVVRINARTNKATVHDSLEDVAECVGFSVEYLRKVVGTDILVKGCLLKYLDD